MPLPYCRRNAGRYWLSPLFCLLKFRFSFVSPIRRRLIVFTLYSLRCHNVRCQYGNHRGLLRQFCWSIFLWNTFPYSFPNRQFWRQLTTRVTFFRRSTAFTIRLESPPFSTLNLSVFQRKLNFTTIHLRFIRICFCRSSADIADETRIERQKWIQFNRKNRARRRDGFWWNLPSLSRPRL